MDLNLRPTLAVSKRQAQGYLNLLEDYDLRQEQIAKMLGKSQSTIANKLRLLKLSPQIQKDLMENGLTERHARVLLKLPDEALQRKVLHQVIEENLTVKHTEELLSLIHIYMRFCGTFPFTSMISERYLNPWRRRSWHNPAMPM